jgi:hypothetical protein
VKLRLLKRVLQAAAILVLLVDPPALAQFATGPNGHILTQEEVDKQKALENAYKAANKKIPDKKSDDPWGGVRTVPQTVSKDKH